MTRKKWMDTHCKHGHEYTPENTMWYNNGQQKRCRECNRKVTSKTSRNYHFVKKYDLTSEQYDEMKKDGCRICGNKDGQLNVDHDHNTGKVRDILCVGCNNGLGCFKDNPELLKKAIEYLEKHGIVCKVHVG